MKPASSCNVPLDASYARYVLLVDGHTVAFDYGRKGWQFTIDGKQDGRGYRELRTAQAKAQYKLERE